MTSNEHPDMSGNPCDDPIVCDQCGDACNESDLYGSIYDEDKNFCRKQCVDDWEEGWKSVPSGSDDHDYGLTRTEQKICTLVAIRDYLRERRDDLHEKGFAGDAQVFGEEIVRLSGIIAKAEAEAEA